MSGLAKPRRDRRILLAVALVLFGVALALSVWLIGTPPPRKIRLATGDPSGAFAVLGQEYKKRLDRMGLQVELIATNGSIDNLHHLQSGRVDVAFVQGGTAQLLEDSSGLCSLTAIGTEPLWVVTRRQVSAASLRDLKGLSVSLGPSSSGTDALGRLLLRAHGVTESNTTFCNLPMGRLPQALGEGKVDAGLIVCAPEAGVIQEVLGSEQTKVVSLDCQAGITRRFPYLHPVVLPQGVLDLERKLPATDLHLLAPAMVLVARENLHPRVVEQLLLTAQGVHSGGNLLDEAGRFPSTEGVDLPLHVTAERFAKSGESLLSRLLSYRGVRLVWQVQLFLLPLLVFLIPFWKTLPLLYTFRINQILKRHYTALREVEDQLDLCEDPEGLAKGLETLEGLRAGLETLSRKLPAHLQRDVYHWRLHVALVRTEGRERLRRLQERIEACERNHHPAKP